MPRARSAGVELVKRGSRKLLLRSLQTACAGWLVGFGITGMFLPRPHGGLPAIADVAPAENAYPLYEAAARAVRPLPARPGAVQGAPTPAQRAARVADEQRAVIAANAPALALFHQAALRPRCQVARAGESQEVQLRHAGEAVAVLHRSLDLDVLAMRLALQDGHADRALGYMAEALDAGFKFAVMPRGGDKGLDLGCKLLGASLQDWRRFEPALSTLPAPVLAGYLGRLNEIQARRLPLETVIAGDRELDRQLLADLKTDPRVWQKNFWMPLAMRIGTPDATIEGALEGLAHQVAIRDYPVLREQAGGKAGVKDVVTVLALFPFRPADMMADVFTRGDGWRLVGILPRWLACDARFQAMRVQVACELYQRAHGRLPGRLEMLVPTYLPAVPTDPCRPGRPLGYRDGHLWSVGFDGTDEGGKGGDRPWTLDARGDFLLF